MDEGGAAKFNTLCSGRDEGVVPERSYSFWGQSSLHKECSWINRTLLSYRCRDEGCPHRGD